MTFASTAELALALSTTNTGNWTYLALHSSAPNATGAGEITTSPRVAVSWSVISSVAGANVANPGSNANTSQGYVWNTATLQVNIAASTTAGWFGLWNSATSAAGTYYIGGALASTVTTSTSPGVITFNGPVTSTSVTSATSVASTSNTYTVANSLSVGQLVTTTGFTGSTYNVTNAPVTAVAGTYPNYTSFTVACTNATGTASTVQGTYTASGAVLVSIS